MGAPLDDDAAALEASVAGLGIVLRSLAPALERVTLQQYRVLVLLVTRGPMRASDLGTELGLLPSGTTRIVGRLVRDGLVARRASASSRREVTVSALPSATALVEQVLDARRTEIRGLLARMTVEERTALGTAARAVVRATDAGAPLDARLLLGAPDPDQPAVDRTTDAT